MFVIANDRLAKILILEYVLKEQCAIRHGLANGVNPQGINSAENNHFRQLSK
jgi:hypothetical protein